MRRRPTIERARGQPSIEAKITAPASASASASERAAKPNARIPAPRAAATPTAVSSTTDAVARRGAHRRRGVQEQVRRGLPALDLCGAEDPAVEPVEEARLAERQPNLLQRSAGGDAGLRRRSRQAPPRFPRPATTLGLQRRVAARAPSSPKSAGAGRPSRPRSARRSRPTSGPCNRACRPRRWTAGRSRSAARREPRLLIGSESTRTPSQSKITSSRHGSRDAQLATAV